MKVYRNIIFPVVLYRHNISSLTSWEESRQKVFENKVMGRLFAPKTGGRIGGWRKLRNEELHNLYSSPNIIRIIGSRRMR
jgi:hypothetical protein